MDLSVIICSRNPRKEYLRRTLDALNRQTLAKDRWELLLIDNASAPPLAGEWDLSWPPQGRHILEPKQGLTRARLAGIEHAAGGIVVFFDDDNLPAETYLAGTLEIARRHPGLGVWGAGKIVPEYEELPDSSLLPYVRFLALRELDKDIRMKTPGAGPLPWGAGLAVRREVAMRYVSEARACPVRIALDRSGDMLISGGDDEFSWVAASLGFEIGIFRQLELVHLIPRRRVQREYLERIIHGNGFSCAILASLHRLPMGTPFRVPRISDVWSSIARGRPLAALRAFARVLRYVTKPALERAMWSIRAAGWDAGIKFLDERREPSTRGIASFVKDGARNRGS